MSRAGWCCATSPERGLAVERHHHRVLVAERLRQLRGEARPVLGHEDGPLRGARWGEDVARADRHHVGAKVGGREPRRRRGGGLRGVAHRAARQGEHELRAAGDAWGRRDRATVRQRQLPHHRQPDAAATSLAHALAARAAREQALEQRGLQADAGVADRDGEPDGVGGQLELDLAAGGRVLDRVGEQVGDHPLVRHRVDDRERVVGEPGLEAQARGLGGRPPHGRQSLGRGGNVDEHRRDLGGAVAAHGELQDLVDQPQQPAGAAADGRERALRRRVEAARAAGLQLAERQRDQRQRRAELVVDVGEEDLARLLGLAQLDDVGGQLVARGGQLGGALLDQALEAALVGGQLGVRQRVVSGQRHRRCDELGHGPGRADGAIVARPQLDRAARVGAGERDLHRRGRRWRGRRRRRAVLVGGAVAAPQRQPHRAHPDQLAQLRRHGLQDRVDLELAPDLVPDAVRTIERRPLLLDRRARTLEVAVAALERGVRVLELDGRSAGIRASPQLLEDPPAHGAPGGNLDLEHPAGVRELQRHRRTPSEPQHLRDRLHAPFGHQQELATRLVAWCPPKLDEVVAGFGLAKRRDDVRHHLVAEAAAGQHPAVEALRRHDDATDRDDRSHERGADPRGPDLDDLGLAEPGAYVGHQAEKRVVVDPLVPILEHGEFEPDLRDEVRARDASAICGAQERLDSLTRDFPHAPLALAYQRPHR